MINIWHPKKDPNIEIDTEIDIITQFKNKISNN